MKKGDLLFVYGSLRLGEGADLSRRFGGEFVSSDTINGELYSLGWYPGSKVSTEPFDPEKPLIYGDIFRIKDQSMVQALDGYEGYPHLFDRRVVHTGDGRTVWVYCYDHTVNPDRRVVSGDWKLRIEQQVQA